MAPVAGGVFHPKLILGMQQVGGAGRGHHGRARPTHHGAHNRADRPGHHDTGGQKRAHLAVGQVIADGAAGHDRAAELVARRVAVDNHAGNTAAGRAAVAVGATTIQPEITARTLGVPPLVEVGGAPSRPFDEGATLLPGLAE